MHLKIETTGVVQGVGFRPFVHSLAIRHGVVGTVLNHSGGVTIHAAGSRSHLDRFVAALSSDAPPASSVERITTARLPDADYEGFRILPSDAESEGFTQIPADLALCEDCRRELHDPEDRRHRYPLINCTNCGPRFTIIRDLPYDRPVTTMAEFGMCAACRAEYEDPADRRFHAQPVACEVCGPPFEYLTSTSDGWEGREGNSIDSIIHDLASGRICLIQGVGGFHLACDAQSDDAVHRLRRRKLRERKPLAVMLPSVEMLREYCIATDDELKLLRSPKAPIVLLRKRERCPVAGSIAEGNPNLGVMLPYSPLHELILHELNRPLVMTSANLSEDPMAYRRDDAMDRMRTIADSAIVHGRRIHMFADDSVTRVIHGRPRVWRRARGYVPEPLYAVEPFKRQVLAFGPQMKNTFCLGRGDVALLSQHLGDLDSEAAVSAQQSALDHFLRLYDMSVEQVACDLHPDYTSTRLAEEFAAEHNLPLTRIQHHHAHLAACLAENQSRGPAIGLCLDGTGYGTDGTMWGGEVLIGDDASFTRFASLAEVPMPGGETAAREPWRMAVAWLHETLGPDWLDLDLPLVQILREFRSEQALTTLMDQHLIESVYPRTTSLGRLFDAAAALVHFGIDNQFEGQAAMGLEWLAESIETRALTFEIRPEKDRVVIRPQPAIEEMVSDLRQGRDPAEIARAFHEGVVDAFIHVTRLARAESGVHTVALSGGCFQNALLLTRLEERLAADGFQVFTHSRVPCNDGGVALGQACIANSRRDEQSAFLAEPG